LTQKYRAGELSVNDLHCNEIQVWSYDPKLFAVAGVVDRLSLFLSLRDEKDERVEAALEQMMKEMPW
jgi:Tfp pilus assembly protein PilO